MTDTNDGDDDPFDESFGNSFEEVISQVEDAFSDFESTGFQQQVSRSDEMILATKLLRAGEALDRFTEYQEDLDIDVHRLDPSEISQMDYDDQRVMFAFMSFGSALERFGNAVEPDDDDGGSSFKVSDGDDPIY